MHKDQFGNPYPRIEHCYLRLSECADMAQFTQVLQDMVNDGWHIQSEHAFARLKYQKVGNIEYAESDQDQIIIHLAREIAEDNVA
jgi:hypothetical protein